MENEWLSLSETAKLLGVHPATARAWGDKGNLPMQRTPGGHRRFRRRDVQARAALTQTHSTGAQIIIQNMLGRARLELTSGRFDEEEWYQHLDVAARQEHAELGRQMLTLVTEYLSGQQTENGMTAVAADLGQAYESLGCKNDLSFTKTVRAYLFFRDFLSQTIYDMAQAAGPQSLTDWGEVRRQIVFLANEVLLAIIETHEERTNE
ncbi:MAG: helix-turn-helix domain-containing protein [Chloroflexi bacterium]|nr:helix-turn-helix domain-containing protein [Chloroflexota bacterium]